MGLTISPKKSNKKKAFLLSFSTAIKGSLCPRGCGFGSVCLFFFDKLASLRFLLGFASCVNSSPYRVIFLYSGQHWTGGWAERLFLQTGHTGLPVGGGGVGFVFSFFFSIGFEIPCK